MKAIKVLGSGCAKCRLTFDLLQRLAQEQGAEVQLEKVEDLREIMKWRVLSTPAVVVDGQVVHVGSVPTRELVINWLH